MLLFRNILLLVSVEEEDPIFGLGNLDLHEAASFMERASFTGRTTILVHFFAAKCNVETLLPHSKFECYPFPASCNSRDASIRLYVIEWLSISQFLIRTKSELSSAVDYESVFTFMTLAKKKLEYVLK
jgi:hypothetical protein